MARAATRSQKPAPSQTQRQYGTQNARAGGSRRAQVEEDPEEEQEEEEEAPAHMDEDDEDEDERDGEGESEVRRKANDLVRLALFMEHKRQALRREDISKKVLGQSTRAFNTVFAHAQEKLRTTFGMEMVELPSRAGLEQEAGPSQNGGDDLDEARKATGMKKKSASLLSKTYIVRSCLDVHLIEHAALTDVQILEDEAIEAPSDSDDDMDDGADDDAERAPKAYGSIISWSKGDQLGATGVLYVVLALVLVSGRVMSDMDLRTQLKRLRLPSTLTRAPVHFTSLATTRSLSTDAFLSLLQRQGYLDRTLVGGEARQKGGKRMRTQPQDDGGERAMYEWRWGARALCEVGEEGVGQFIAEFMVGSTEGEGEGEEEEGSRAERKKHEERLARMLRGVERAAGGKLMELR